MKYLAGKGFSLSVICAQCHQSADMHHQTMHVCRDSTHASGEQRLEPILAVTRQEFHLLLSELNESHVTVVGAFGGPVQLSGEERSLGRVPKREIFSFRVGNR